MKKIDEYVKKVDYNLLTEFNREKKNDDFKTFVDKINLPDEVLCKKTSKLKDSLHEFNNCLNCKGLAFCKNELKGHRYTYELKDNNLNFLYEPCHFMKKELDLTKHTKNVSLYNISSSLKNAKVKDIYTDDKSRIEIILYINDYISSYFKNRKKGVYLTGNFGSGKTYLIAALFNELAKKDVRCAIVYFPEFLRTLKESFKEVEEGVSYSDKFNYIKKIPLLLIDDIGAENLSTWARDEILGSILQYRMEEDLPTFFTSNLTLDELESHLSMAGSKVDKVKARRIIERIKYLTTEMTLIGVDRRN